jgi:tyrosyl-tRNA synthetase
MRRNEMHNTTISLQRMHHIGLLRQYNSISISKRRRIMSQNVFDILKERGFIAQTTHEDKIRELLGDSSVTFYIGFDPTADSLHVGHLLQLIVMSHMQRAGHRPIAIIGGGTAMVGDPSGKTDMRKMLTREEITHNGECFRSQMRNLVDFGEGKAMMIDNADWLLELNYVEFLRNVGVHFSVNRMLSADCFKSRLEKGLSFIEFNYMLMQGYDFQRLYEDYGCRLQLGGDDQWSNILAGADLIRRAHAVEAYGMTFNLLTTSEGKKMGKTEKGAVWLDPAKTSSYEFFQYWRNINDSDVMKCLKLLTFLPMEQILEMETWEDGRINETKAVLAYELVKIVHGPEEADKAKEAAASLFGGGHSSENMPTVKIDGEHLKMGISILDLLSGTGIVPSKGEARRLIQQGGLYINNQKIESFDHRVNETDLDNDEIIVRKGKKSYHRIICG